MDHFLSTSSAIPFIPRTIPDTGSASGNSLQPSEGRDYPLRRRNEPAPNDGGSTDSLSMILKELRLLKKEIASNKAEVDKKMARIMHDIR
jgi:hypothetical protein